MVEVVVRAYDLGGFGDIAGAMRVASFLKRRGISSCLRATSDSALEKMKILNPDTTFTREQPSNEAIQVDVAGHYLDGRVAKNTCVPHSYTEDMDHPNNRGEVVPIYLKSGLAKLEADRVPTQINLGRCCPMFYRPFREWDLPKPGERDARRQILEAMRVNKKLFGGVSVGKLLPHIDKIGFAHISPKESPVHILRHPYFWAIQQAQKHTNQKYGIGVFLNGEVEKSMNVIAQDMGWNLVHANGTVDEYNPQKPTLFFLGSQPQITTTGLFLSSNIPNLVTGDLSLSDAIYGLIAMDGPAFYYETAPWKVPTHIELAKMLDKIDPALSNIYMVGSNPYRIPENLSADQREEYKKVWGEAIGYVIGTFAVQEGTEKYRQNMQRAIRHEILRRFGNVQVIGGQQNGYYIQPGAPYLFQDATATIVDALRNSPDLFAETEKTRRAIANGTPLVVSVSSGTLEPTPLSKNKPSHLDLSKIPIGQSNGKVEYKPSYLGNPIVSQILDNPPIKYFEVQKKYFLGEIYSLEKLISKKPSYFSEEINSPQSKYSLEEIVGIKLGEYSESNITKGMKIYPIYNIK